MSPPRRSSAWRRWRLFRYLLPALLVPLLVAGLALGVAWGLGYVDRLRPPLMASLSAALGTEVASERLHLGLAGLTPRLTLEQVVLGNSADAATQTRLPRLHLDVDLPASLASREPRLKALVIEGPRLQLARDAYGQLVVSGITVGGGGDIGSALRHFLDLGRLEVTAGEIDWREESAAPPRRLLSGLRLSLDNQGGTPRLEIQAALADPRHGGRLHLTADRRGGGDTPSDWSGQVEFALHTQLAQDLVQEKSQEMLEEILQEQDHEKGQETALETDQQGGQESTQERAQENARVKAQGKTRELAHNLVQVLPHYLDWPALGELPPAFEVAVGALDLSGRLDIEAGRFQALQAQLSVQELSLAGEVAAHGPLALEAARLEFQVTADPRAGRLQVAGTDLILGLPAVFGARPPLRVDHLAGPLDWALDPVTGLSLSGKGLSASNPDLGVRLAFSSRVPWTTPGGGGDLPALSALAPAAAELDLRGEILNATAARIRDYLPDPHLRPRARAWLDRAFPAGRVPWGLVLFQGRLGDFPFRQGPGDFQILLRVEDMALDFDPDWPRLNRLEGIVHFHNQGLAIATQGGRIQEVPLLEVQASIPDLAETRFLGVKGTAQGLWTWTSPSIPRTIPRITCAWTAPCPGPPEPTPVVPGMSGMMVKPGKPGKPAKPEMRGMKGIKVIREM